MTDRPPRGTRGREPPSRRRVLAATATAGIGLAALFGRGGRDAEAAPADTQPHGAPGTPTPSKATIDPEPELEARATGTASESAPVLGANLNGRPHRLLGNLELLEASRTTWLRAFIDVRAKLATGGDPREDPDVVALRRAAREYGCKLIVSLKWDFKANWGDKDPVRIPPASSSRERALLEGAVDYLAAIGEPVDIVVLGNEPMWETLDPDVKVADPPIVRFTERVLDHLDAAGTHGDPDYLVGAFNRSNDERIRRREFPGFHRGMADLVASHAAVSGIDLHVHYNGFETARGMIEVARDAYPDGRIIVSEFSPVWRYRKHVNRPIGASRTGGRFARDHDLPPDMTAVEYFERAKRDPRPPAELADFYRAMPWYNVDHVSDMHTLLAEFDVDVATFGFLQDVGMRREDWSRGWLPFHINFLYQPALTRSTHGIEGTANRDYLEDYQTHSAPDAVPTS